MKQMKVDAIKNGTVIDHISAGKGMQVAEIINISGENEVFIGVNLQSKKIGKKDIIKIENRELTSEQVNTVALIAPQATLVIIKNYEVAKKVSLKLQENIENIVVCPNPKCITNVDNIPTKFKLVGIEPTKIRCVYCERKYNVDEISIRI
ncbi:MAG: aspartate carbamoyltransferase regulatory subunit [Candidatus Cloacimonetes bacterium]|nr:aspartate carbamoyltransferase regulatory subunit [Candidatus Cloacimonadota bacterium]